MVAQGPMEVAKKIADVHKVLLMVPELVAIVRHGPKLQLPRLRRVGVGELLG